MKRTLLIFLALASNLFAQEPQDQPTTREDLTAIDQIDSGELDLKAAPIYTKEQVEAFLNQFVGVWEGDYVIGAMQSKGKVTMTTNTQYYWELVGEQRVLKNRSVYAVGEQLSHSTSLSYFWAGRLVTEVEQDEQKRVFFGQISPEGDSVQWSIANSQNPLNTSTRETFSTNADGKPVIKVKGYEEIRQGAQSALLVLNAELVKGDLE